MPLQAYELEPLQPERVVELDAADAAEQTAITRSAGHYNRAPREPPPDANENSRG